MKSPAEPSRGLAGKASPTNSLCSGNMKDLAGDINSLLQSVTKGFVPASDRDEGKHTRPISLTPVLDKVLESVTRRWVMNHISEDLYPHQYGLVKDSSPVHGLVELIHNWQHGLDVRGKG